MYFVDDSVSVVKRQDIVKCVDKTELEKGSNCTVKEKGTTYSGRVGHMVSHTCENTCLYSTHCIDA